MNPRLYATVRNVLAVWGAVSLVAVIVIVAVVADRFVPSGPTDDRATKSDVRFVLNWPALGEERIEAVVRSHESVVHLNGDHFTAYAIRVTSLSESELSSSQKWVRGDRTDELMTQAIRFVTEAGQKAPWFPAADELLTDKYYVFRSRVEVTNGVSAADLIFARPSDRMIFYASLQI